MQILPFSRARAKIFKKITKMYVYRSCKSVGKNFTLGKGVIIKSSRMLSLGDDVGINDYTWINAAGRIRIGNDVNIGPRVVIHSSNHKYLDPTIMIRLQGHDNKPVVIEDDVWIGAGAIILPGANIGVGSVVAAGAVVTKDVEPYTVVAGVPARKIRDRISNSSVRAQLGSLPPVDRPTIGGGFSRTG